MTLWRQRKRSFRERRRATPIILRRRRGSQRRDLTDAAPTTRRQTLTPIADSDWFTLEVKRDAAPKKPLAFPIKSESLQENEARFLASTLYVQADDLEIKAAAKEIVDGAEDAWEAAKRISKWTHSYVKEKRFDRGYATAKETARFTDGRLHRAYDAGGCVDARGRHSCAGLSRASFWLKDGFYYHFWHEAYVGEWIALDATLGQTPADARRIQLSAGEMESDSALELTFGLLQTLNILELRASE